MIGDALVEYLTKELLQNAFVPIELRIEMMLLGDAALEEYLAGPLLDNERNAWALTSVPAESVRLILEVSKRRFLFNWVAESMNIMSTRDHGPEFVRSAGMLSSFRLVLFAVQNLPANSYSIDGLTGMVEWA